MKRPDIEGNRKYIKDCCERHNFTRFCESWGCSSVKQLIDYIEVLELKIAFQQGVQVGRAERCTSKASWTNDGQCKCKYCHRDMPAA